jgi:molybdopterin converting factor subunit 1
VRVRLRFFASLRERLGAGERDCTLDEGATVADLWQTLCAENASLAEVGPSLSFAVNREYVDRDAPLRDGDEVALIPPVSGG